MEFAEIKKHTEIGYDIVNENGFFGEIRDLIRYHHEKMDGTGYYAKQNGDYPWEAMIISLADIYDALASDRPYRLAFSTAEALDALEQLVGVNFDERIFAAFRTWIAENHEPKKQVPMQTTVPSRT
jgi:HD-GYP domain-containing protein (c-di-GMP phosphodiesterase class II)